MAAYALERLGVGDDRAQVIELVEAKDLPLEKLVELLRAWADLQNLPTVRAERALRRWMLAALTSISRSGDGSEAKLDRLEAAYAEFGYPEEMRQCSRYYLPPHDRDRGIEVGEATASPLDAMNELLSQVSKEMAESSAD